MTTSGLAFIVSHISVSGGLPVEIIDQHTFRAATDPEIEQIKRVLEMSVPRDTNTWVPYEKVVKTEYQTDGSRASHFEELPRDQWKYWVIAFNGPNSLLHEIELVAQILPFSFDIGFVLFYGLPNQQGEFLARQTMPFHIIERHGRFEQFRENASIATRDQIACLGMWFDMYRQLPEDFSFVRAALNNFGELRRIPSTSDLAVVGLFSIIESLITHAPRLTETLDSINHQITSKIILLRKRYSRAVTPDSYFAHASEENIWKKLYSYRSSVAHGSPVSVEKSEFQVLKNRQAVINFLQDNVKELLHLGLKEPEFLFDLRRC